MQNNDEIYQQMAIDAGALLPQTVQERTAAGVMAYNGQRWADTPVARQRLAQWTQMAREGKTLPTGGTGCLIMFGTIFGIVAWSMC